MVHQTPAVGWLHLGDATSGSCTVGVYVRASVLYVHAHKVISKLLL